MRWMYVPFMFALAFIYTKLAFNDFMPREGLSRSPASPDLNCKEMIQNFYPNQSAEFIEKRLDANKDLHSFYRAFAPVFYKQVAAPEFAALYAPLKNYRGTIAGDLHIENFGFVIDDKGRAFFTLNDFDDATDGLLYPDIIRHFISGKMVDKNLEWKNYFEAYAKGLRGEDHQNSFYVQKGLEDVSIITEKTLKKFVGESVPFKFIKKKTPSRPTSADELNALTKSLKEKYHKIEIFDHYVRIKEDGGSAGLKRFQVLARLKPQDKVQWLDIKESTESGYDKVYSVAAVPFEKRVEAFKNQIYDNRLNKSIETMTIQGRTYSVRHVDQFTSGLKLEDIPEDDYIDIIMDEAYAVGRMHRLSLGDQALDYVKAWQGINVNSIEESLINLKFKIKDLYNK